MFWDHDSKNVQKITIVIRKSLPRNCLWVFENFAFKRQFVHKFKLIYRAGFSNNG
ncbi:hypothetical protein LEP1GSC168_0522 [Leptospira santarosai str. HAI134]|nr:hypothetical protein LEP1GSC168_0522 [Leptospira santarosai str. HAI134]